MAKHVQRDSRFETILNFFEKNKLSESKVDNNTGSCLFKKQLCQFYVRDPLIKFIASRPVMAGICACALGFGGLTVVNYWTDTLCWSKPQHCMNTFLSQPIDWVNLPILIPIGVWLIGNYYASLYHSIVLLIVEKRIDVKKVSALLRLYKKNRFLSVLPVIICWLGLTFFAYFVWVTYPRWTPAQITCWYSNINGTPSVSGFVMYFLFMLEAYMLFTVVIDTFRFNCFHKKILYNKHSNTFETSIKLNSYHPDKVYGYAPLAKPMNYATNLVAVTLIILAFYWSSNLILFSRFGILTIIIFAIETIFVLLLLPWFVMGPLLPFIVMLYRKREERIQELRILLARDIENKSRMGIIDEWNAIQQGWPFIIEKRSIGIFVATILFTQASQLGPIFMKLIRIFMPWV